MTSISSRVKALSLALALVGSVAMPGLVNAQTSAGVATVSTDTVRAKGGEFELHAKVVELDQAQRSIVLRTKQGKLLSVDVPASIPNFEQVRVGDGLVIRYAAAVAVELEPLASTTGIREKIESMSDGKSNVGGLPGAVAGRKVEVLAVVEGIDRQARTVKLRGVKRIVTVKAPDNVDLAKIKVGQEVRAVFIEAAAVSVERRAVK
ncbi:MAG: hypothetical protein K2W93_13400 [Burkholderiaceae bacterium]|nr:hypothetical protein [Burkholderiaceae bacterium]